MAGPCSTLQGMAEGLATITVTRQSPEDVRHRQIYVSVDGKEFAELLYGETFTGSVPAGRHRLRANNTLVWKTIECNLRPGEHARFTVVNRPFKSTVNIASQRVILANGGVLVEEFVTLPSLGAKRQLRYHVQLD